MQVDGCWIEIIHVVYIALGDTEFETDIFDISMMRSYVLLVYSWDLSFESFWHEITATYYLDPIIPFKTDIVPGSQ